MTEKRFEINNDMNLDNKIETYELSCIIDNDNKTFYFIVNSIANVESFVERLNELHEEKEQLKKQLELYGELYPTGKWITELTSEELEKELEE